MPTPTNHYKLGLFVILGLGAALLFGALLGGASLRRETTKCHSYFNESVQGLELGAPVKFRGVTIGRVSAIEIAPDRRMVDVTSELDTGEVRRLGLFEQGRRRGEERFKIPPDLRAQLNSQGITGVKFVAIDFFDVKSNPPPLLPFAPPVGHYIPAASSMMKNVEDTITRAMERLPEMVDAVVMIMSRVDGLIAKLEAEDVSGKAAGTLNRVDAVIASLKRTLERIEERDIPGRAAETMSELNTAIAKLNLALDAISGQAGLLASARHATDALGELGRNGRVTQRELETMLRDVSEAAESIRNLVEGLEREPDMLLKGKAIRRVAQ